MKKIRFVMVLAVFGNFLVVPVWAEESGAQGILRNALLGAGTGAISASTSGGKAGKGALIGAGTSVIGGALFDTLLGGRSSTTAAQSSSYYQSYGPVTYQTQQAVPVYYTAPAQEVYTVQPAPAYASYNAAPQTDPNRTIIRNGLLGAGVGAISAGASGGKAGTGALVGAGTNVIGTALFDTLLSPSGQARPQTPYYYPNAPNYSNQYPVSNPAPSGTRRIVRHYDAQGKLVSEEEFLN